MSKLVKSRCKLAERLRTDALGLSLPYTSRHMVKYRYVPFDLGKKTYR